MNMPRLQWLMEYARMLISAGQQETNRFTKTCDAIEKEIELEKKK